MVFSQHKIFRKIEKKFHFEKNAKKFEKKLPNFLENPGL